jgi:F0F1-type ATP synthase delta subunit
MNSQEIAAKLYLKVNSNSAKKTDLGLLLISAFDLLQGCKTDEVLDQYNKILNHELLVVEVITAKEIEKSTEKQLEEKLILQFGESIVITYTLDTQIVGGMIIKCGDNMIDQSLKSKIDRV